MKSIFLSGIILSAVFLIGGCSSSKDQIQGLPYDPPGSTITTNKTIYPQHKRTFLFNGKKLYVSNEFTGSRLNDFYQENDTTFVAVIEPENSPINNSAWYAFKIWSEKDGEINLKILYKDGSHRYIPKLSYDGKNWTPIESNFYFNDTSKGIANVKLKLKPDTLWAAAQELFLSKDYERWMNELAGKSFVKKSTIGQTVNGRAISKLEISEGNDISDLVFIIGRQHPPEVTGAFALKSFVEKLTDDSQISKIFRKRFRIIVIPLVNPDGVDEGHWRHNSNGVDLNRDWFAFNQPETRIVRDELLRTVNESKGKVKFFIDFHSTQQDVFYITSKDSTVETDPVYETTKSWLNRINEMFPDYKLNVDESLNDYNAPTSDSWAYNIFNAPALTYELGDETDRAVIRKICSGAAEAMMEILLKDKK
jgi:predicted deacylase